MTEEPKRRRCWGRSSRAGSGKPSARPAPPCRRHRLRSLCSWSSWSEATSAAGGRAMTCSPSARLSSACSWLYLATRKPPSGSAHSQASEPRPGRSPRPGHSGRVEVAGLVAGPQVVDVLGPEPAQRNRDELGLVASGAPGPPAPVEQRLTETEPEVVQLELVLAGLVDQRDLLDDLTAGGQRDAVLDAEAGRPPGAEVELVEQGQRGPGVVVVLDRPVQRAHPGTADRPAVEAGAGHAAYGQLVAVALVGHHAPGRPVDQFVRVELRTVVDPQPPGRADQDQLPAPGPVVLHAHLH